MNSYVRLMDYWPPVVANMQKHLSELIGLYTSKHLYMIKACPLLPDIEALRMPNRKISNVHAISANNHNYLISI